MKSKKDRRHIELANAYNLDDDDDDAVSNIGPGAERADRVKSKPKRSSNKAASLYNITLTTRNLYEPGIICPPSIILSMAPSQDGMYRVYRAGNACQHSLFLIVVVPKCDEVCALLPSGMPDLTDIIEQARVTGSLKRRLDMKEVGVY